MKTRYLILFVDNSFAFYKFKSKILIKEVY